MDWDTPCETRRHTQMARSPGMGCPVGSIAGNAAGKASRREALRGESWQGGEGKGVNVWQGTPETTWGDGGEC